MFDCRTHRTPIERLGSIVFDIDWFLVRFRSIDYPGFPTYEHDVIAKLTKNNSSNNKLMLSNT